MVGVIMLRVSMLNVLMLRVIMLNVLMLRVIMLNVFMLSVMAPFSQAENIFMRQVYSFTLWGQLELGRLTFARLSWHQIALLESCNHFTIKTINLVSSP
jgi:hypothetical protein